MELEPESKNHDYVLMTFSNYRKFFITVLLLLSASTVFSNPIDSLAYYKKHKEFHKGLQLARSHTKKYLSNNQFEKYCEASIVKSEFYFWLNDTKKSIETLFAALKVAEENQFVSIKIKILEEIGHRYASLRDHNKAKQYYHKSLFHAKKTNKLKPDAFIFQRLFRVHLESNSDSAIYYLNKIRENALKKNSHNDLAISYNNFYTFYAAKENHELAKKYLDSSIFYAQKSNSKDRIITSLHNLGYHYLVAEEDYKKGIEQYEKLLKIIPQDSVSQNVGDIYLNLSYGYEQMGNHKKALDYTNKYIDINETIYQDNIKRAINEIETKYQIEKIEKQNLEKQKAFEDRQKNNQKIILIFIALFAFSTIMFYFFYQNLRLKQKNSFIEMDREVKQNIINATLDGQESERKQVANVLHDGISALLSSAGLHLSAYVAANPNEKKDEIEKVRSILKEAHDNVRDLSHELIPPLLVKFGLFHALQDLCEKNSNSIIEFEYSSHVPENRRYSEEFEMRIYFIVTELFNNIIKHSKASRAFLTLEENQNRLEITIEDDGRGFDTSKPLVSDGFGLTQIKSRVKHLGGKIAITSKINAGTIVFISIRTSKK